MGSVSPGGVAVSSAKRRRLAALEAASRSTPGALPGTKITLKPGGQKPGTGSQYKATSQQPNRGPELASSKEAVLEPQYAGLSAAVAIGPLINPQLSHGSQGSRSVELILEDVISTNKSVSDARAATASRLHNKVLLLDNPTATLTTKSTRRKHIRCSSQIASRKNRPAFDQNYQYTDFDPLHKLWTQYITGLLKNSKDVEARILAADLHGCKLTVTQAANPAHAGLTGLVIKETPQAFMLLTVANRTHHVLKDKSVFCFTLDERRKVTLLGTNLQRERSKS